MQSLAKFSLPVLLFCVLLFAQSYDITFEKKTGYNGWSANWDMVYAAKNSIVSVAIVPKLGGRVMQYDLGSNKFIYIFDPTKTPTSGDDMVGGFRVLPSPQSDFGWPSPPNLDFNPYTCVERVNNADSVVLYLESQVENSTDSKYQKHKGLQFKRVITLYKASTRVKVEMTMLNKGTQSMTHGIWDITQTTCASANCWVYFQRNPTSTLGGGKGYVQYMNEGADATQWKPNAAEGNIMGVQYLKKVGKIGADCTAGWICFNDRQSGYASVKTFAYQAGKKYPDSGASVQVYTYDNTYNMLEVEVLGPLVTLAAGDSTKLVENWFAARSFGPVLAVNGAGLITKKLAATQTADTISVTGTFGVFYPGAVKSQFCNASGTLVATADSVAVIPTDSLSINKKFALPAGATGLRLTAFNVNGNPVGTLDSVAVPTPVGVDKPARSSIPYNLCKKPLFLRSNGALFIDVPYRGTFSAELFTVDGKHAATIAGKGPCRHELALAATSPRIFLVNVKAQGRTVRTVVCVPGR
jgi:hypothetical protein